MRLASVFRRATRVVACLLLLGACSRDKPQEGGSAEAHGAPPRAVVEPGFPLEERDDNGRAVTLASAPRRIVSLLPSHTEILFALGVGDRVVGVDDYSDFPPEAARIPKLGGGQDASVERVVAIAPDLVLAPDSGPTAARLAAQGLHVWAGTPRKLDEVYRMIETLGRLTGRRGEATSLASRIRKEVEVVEAEVRGLPRVRVYYEIDPAPYAVGPSSFLGALLAKAGGANIVPDGLGEFPRVSPELVIEKNPELILGVTKEDAARRPGWPAVDAVRAGRVEALSEAERSCVVRPGPRLAESLRALARYLHARAEP